MKQINSARLVAATAALLAVSFSASLVAQTQMDRRSSLQLQESALLLLPEAPQPQATPAPAPTAPPTTPDSSSSSTAPPATTGPQTVKERHDEAERELQQEEKQRLLGVMPQFQVINGGVAVPLTAGEKWRLALHSAIDPFYIADALVIGGGYGELVDSHTGFHHGPAGYFKRVGASYADNVNGAIIGNALLPSILHQDPRYFRMGSGPIKKRFLHAALSTVICRGDNGKNQFNTSNVLGNFISGAISNAYYPADERGLGLTFENGAEVTLFGAVGGQLLEFGPDIAKHLRKKHPTPPAPPASPTTTP